MAESFYHDFKTEDDRSVVNLRDGNILEIKIPKMKTKMKTTSKMTKYWSKNFKATKRFGPKSFVKIGSVIAEIFLSWTNVARTNVSNTVDI